MLGPYRIDSLIGEGGMGQVYRGVDTRLDRVVAIKVLPSHLSSHPDLRERFDREARAISSLSHPNICTLFDVGHHDGIDYLVMEYLEGESVADRIRRGPLPLTDVLRYGAEIAEALARAHRQGVVHRDLKPGNVMLTKSGAKLLDFGLAKAAGPTLFSDPNAPTEAQDRYQPLTREGTVVGTFQYMAPEQLEGKEADTRTDLFALGCVLYEMTTGLRAFEGATGAAVSAAIMTRTPTPVSELQPLTPSTLAHVISRCLAKDPDERWQSASDVAAQLRWIGQGSGAAQPAPVAPRRLRSRLPWAIAISMAAAAIALAAILWRRGPSPEPQTTYLTVLPPSNTAISSDVAAHNIALSPDGSQMVFVAALPAARPLLWVRPLRTATARALAGTEGAISPFWSPDGRFIAYFGDGQLKKIASSGGPPQTICPAFPGSGTWGGNDTILFVESEGREGIQRVSASGGTAKPAVHPVPRRPAWGFWPHLLPDGRHFLYVETNVRNERSLFLSSLDSKERTAIPGVRSRAVYAPPGFLIYAREGSLLAQKFDLASKKTEGESIVLAPEVPYFDTTGWADFSVSQNGVLAFLSGAIQSRLVWFSREGHEIATLGEPGGYGALRISPDGRKAVTARADPRTLNDDVWIYDLSRNIGKRFTSEPGNDFNAIWHSDGQRIIYALDVLGSATLYEKTLSESGKGTELMPMERFKLPHDCSPDGRLILYSDTSAETGFDLWILPMDGDRKPRPFQRTRFDESAGAFSPDGRWISFVSSESGIPDVYVQRSDGSGEKYRISTAGGSAVRWRRDGKELFYIAGDDRVMAVPVSAGETFTAGDAIPLFAADPNRFKAVVDAFYDVTADGQRFLVNTRVSGAQRSPIDVVTNWMPGGK